MKNKILISVLLTIILTIFSQFVLKNVEYNELYLDDIESQVKIKSMFSMEKTEDNWYSIEGENPQIYIELENEVISVIKVDIERFYYTDKTVKVYYANENEDFTEEKSTILNLTNDCIIEIPKGTYSKLRIDFGNTNFEDIQINGIYVYEDKVTTIQKILSKFSLEYTIMVSIVIVIVLYNYFKQDKEKRKKILPYLIIGFLIFLISQRFNFYGDDIKIKYEYLDVNSMIFFKDRFLGWSSRFVLDVVMVFLFFNQTLWSILFAAIVSLLCYSIIKIVGNNSKSMKWLTVGLFLLYPLQDMNSAGWIATSCNYIFCLGLGIYSMIPIKKYFKNEKIKIYEYILYSLAIIYAASQEQMALILCGFYLIFIIYMKYKKILNKFMCVLFSLACISLISHLVCPGVDVRTALELQEFLDYQSFTLLQKLEIGYSSTLYLYLMQPNIIFITFSLILFGATLLTNNNKKIIIISAIPLVVTTVFGSFSNIFGNLFPYINNIKNALTLTGTNIKIAEFSTWIPDMILLTTVVSILITLFKLFKDKRYSYLTIIIFVAGFLSRIIIGFSPTVWRSGNRTYIYMYFSMIIISLLIYSEIYSSKEKSIKNKVVINIINYTVAIFAVLNLVYYFTI